MGGGVGERTRADACGAGGAGRGRTASGCGKHVHSMCNICMPRVVAAGCGRCAQCGRRGEGDLHVDASAVAGERGLRASLSRGANEQLVRGSDWVC